MSTSRPDPLNPPLRAVLDDIVSRLIPDDALGPGGLEAGAALYIVAALAGPLSELAPIYQAGLLGVDQLARDEYGIPFADLTGPQQDAVLGRVEHGDHEDTVSIPEGFFDMIREHTIEGFLGDPRHGGNAGEVGWALISYKRLGRPFSATEQGAP